METVSLVRALKITTSGPNNFLYLTRLCLITSVQHRCQSGNRQRGSSASCDSSGWWGWISDSQKTNGRTGFCTAGGNWGRVQRVHSGETQMLFDLEGLDVYAFNINNHLLGMDSYSDKAVHVKCNTHNELLISIEETNFLAFWETRNKTKNIWGLHVVCWSHWLVCGCNSDCVKNLKTLAIPSTTLWVKMQGLISFFFYYI